MLFGGSASVSVAGRSHIGRWQEPGGPGLTGVHAPGPHMASDVTTRCCHATSGDTRPFTSGPTVTRPSPWLQPRALVSTSGPYGSGPQPASDLGTATESRCSHLGHVLAHTTRPTRCREPHPSGRRGPHLSSESAADPNSIAPAPHSLERRAGWHPQGWGCNTLHPRPASFLTTVGRTHEHPVWGRPPSIRTAWYSASYLLGAQPNLVEWMNEQVSPSVGELPPM